MYQRTCIPNNADGSAAAPVHITLGNGGQWLTTQVRLTCSCWPMSSLEHHSWQKCGRNGSCKPLPASRKTCSHIQASQQVMRESFLAAARSITHYLLMSLHRLVQSQLAQVLPRPVHLHPTDAIAASIS